MRALDLGTGLARSSLAAPQFPGSGAMLARLRASGISAHGGDPVDRNSGRACTLDGCTRQCDPGDASDFMEAQAKDKELRIALVMGGGVSLGSFSSGALVQLCERLAELEAQGKRKLSIDVATGASAGAMTLAVFYRYLYAGASPQSMLAAMRDCWVDGVGIDARELSRQLLPNLSRHEAPALLSDRPLRVLGERHLLGYQGDGTAPSLLADRAYLSFSLTNLNGLEHRAPAHWSSKEEAGTPGAEAGRDALTSTAFEDRIRFRLHKGAAVCALQGPADPLDHARPILDLGAEAWQEVLDAALASGAFPGAFAPVSMLRYPEEYAPEIWPQALQGQPHAFRYVDGGLLNNEPLKEALELAHRLDQGEDPERYERVFLFVDPVVSQRSAQLRFSHELEVNWRAHYDPQRDDFDYQPARPDYMSAVRQDLTRVSSVVFGQATFHDWLQLGKVNQRAEWLNRFSELVSPYLSQLALPEALLTQLQGLAAEIDHVQGPAGQECYAEPKKRDLQGAMLLLDLLAKISGLARKRDVNVIAISPWSAQHAPVQLAGDFAGAFGGFFKQAWRAHDFEVGRVILQNTLSQDALAQKLFGPAAPAKPLPKLPSGYDEVAPSVRAHFERVLQEHCEAFLQELGVPLLVDQLLAWRLRRALVDRLREPSSAQVRPLMIRILGSGVHPGQALLGASHEHSTPAFGSPLALVAVIELRFDPQASADESPYRMHGPELFSQDGDSYFCVDASEVPGAPQARSRLVLAQEPKAWFELAGRLSQIEVAWEGQAEMTILPDPRSTTGPGV